MSPEANESTRLDADKLSSVLLGFESVSQREWRWSVFEFLDGACKNEQGTAVEEDTNRLEVKYFTVSGQTTSSRHSIVLTFFQFQTHYLRRYMETSVGSQEGEYCTDFN